MLEIITMGQFDLIHNGRSLLAAGSYPHRTLRLLKYFLTNMGRKILPENIIDDLWYDRDLIEPINALRTQISRLRRLFSNDGSNRQLFSIENISGYYTFKILGEYFFDVEELEKIIKQGMSLIENKPEEGMKLLDKGISLYKGEYLGELEYEEWLVPFRNRINRLYLKGLYNYLDKLKGKNKNREIVNICEASIQYDPYGEGLHIYFIEGLMEIGEIRYALSHYEYITSRMYNNLGIAPSKELGQLYGKLQNYETDSKRPIDIRGLDGELNEGETDQGALICEPFYFKFLYNLEKRKRRREGERKVFLGLISIEDKGHLALSEEDLQLAMETLMDIVGRRLRSGDVLSRWNERQIVSLHYEMEEEDLEIIVRRLRERLNRKVEDSKVELIIKFKPI